MTPGRLPLPDRAADWLARRVRWWVALAGLLLFAGFIVAVLPAQAAAGEFYTSLHPAPDTERWYSPADLYARRRSLGRDRPVRVRTRPRHLRRDLAAGVRDRPADRVELDLGQGHPPWEPLAADRPAPGAGGAARLRREPLHRHGHGPLSLAYARPGRARSGVHRGEVVHPHELLPAAGDRAGSRPGDHDPPPTRRSGLGSRRRRTPPVPADCRWHRAGSRPWTSPPRSR
jgi:hypothetical protein